MNEYRVLLCDDIDGKVFSFAILVRSGSRLSADWLARYEFPTADVINVKLIKCCGDDV